MGVVLAMSLMAATLGFILGFAVHAAFDRKTFRTTRKFRKDGCEEVPDVFLLQCTTVESACKERDPYMRELTPKDARKVARICRIIARDTNAGVLEAALNAKTRYRIALLDEGDEGRDDMEQLRYDAVYFVPEDLLASVLRFMGLTYGTKGFELYAGTDANCYGNIYTYVEVSWEKGIERELLDKVEWKCQVESFKKGVPLADIVA